MNLIEETLGLVFLDDGVESVESLHLVCGECFTADPECPAVCGVEDDNPYDPNTEYQNCVVCFDYLETRVCSKGHVLNSAM